MLFGDERGCVVLGLVVGLLLGGRCLALVAGAAAQPSPDRGHCAAQGRYGASSWRS